MAGHSHWAGIKHKKGRQDKVRSKLFSKLSREITVAAKLGDKDPGMNPRLRSAIQAAKQSNMPKENINRAISKSELVLGENYENLRYEGYGAFNTALIIEALTDNKNRTASTIRTILQKNGGRLGETGSTSHLFYNCGVVRIENKNRRWGRAWVLGWLTHDDYFKKARKLTKGQKDPSNGFIVRADCHNVAISELNEFRRSKC